MTRLDRTRPTVRRSSRGVLQRAGARIREAPWQLLFRESSWRRGGRHSWL